MNPQVSQNKTASKEDESLTVIDNRTGKSYNIPIDHGTINSRIFFKMTGEGVKGLRTYDPGYMNTASCTSRITFIDGPKGLLAYRGVPIEQLAKQSNFLEVAFLLIYGVLPSQQQSKYWNDRVMKHTYIHEDLKRMMQQFRYDAHPMGMLISTVAAMSTLHPEANPALAGQDVYSNAQVRNKQIHRLIGTIPTIAAYAYRHRVGRPYVDPRSDLGYTENFLYMMDKLSDSNYKPHPSLAKALDVLFTLHADHEQNCSTTAMRHLTSSGVDVYTSIAGANAALYGPSHGGANEAVLRMLMKIGDKSNIPSFIADVKAKKVKLMGFGHRVYKNYDPRARIVKQIAEEVFSITGREDLIDVAMELERIALTDDYFKKRSLYPNVDFYSGLIYKAMGIPTDFFVVMFAIPRTVGWLANWLEFLDDPEKRIVRPRQKYLGPKGLSFVPMAQRAQQKTAELVSNISSRSKRRSGVAAL